MTRTIKSTSDDSPTQLFGRLWRSYLRPHLPKIALAFLLMLIEGSTLGALSYMLQPMFDLVFVEGRTDALWWVAIGIFSLFAIRAVAGVSQRVLMTAVSLRASTEMQKDLLRHSIGLDHAYHASTSPGAMIERVQGDVGTIQSLWNVIITGAGRDIIALISLLGVALTIDWKWTIVAIVGAPLLLLPSIVVQRYIRRKSTSLREIAGQRTTQLDEIFHGITPIKLNRLENYQNTRFSDTVDKLVGTSIKASAAQSTVPGLVDLAVGFGFFCVMIYGGPQIIAGEKTIGQFMSFFTAMALAFQPLRRLGTLAGYWQMMQASLTRIYGLFDTQPTIVSRPATEAKNPNGSTIEFDQVSLSYGDLPVLNELSFTAKQGATTALIGQSGAGKSTVFNVLTRLFDPQSGEARIGGVSVSDMDLPNLRDQFSVVSQEALLFDETLRENLLAGRTDVSEDELNAALNAAHVSDFIKSLPNGLETRVGARGSNLSGGQRQRVAIARAILRDAPILLLDEATSALDAESEKIVQQALDRLSENRTTLVIAHRLSTIRNADKILVLDQGRLVEEGTHELLLKQGGTYARLHDLQFPTGTRPFTQLPNLTSREDQGTTASEDGETGWLTRLRKGALGLLRGT